MIPVKDLKRGFELYQEEYEAKALEVLRSGWYILGKEVGRFEEAFAQAMGEPCFAVGVDSGLDAILFGLRAAGIRPGDEVILQANGYIATVLAVLHCGATPVFADADGFFQMDAEKLEAAVTEKTRAVLVTHLYGAAAEMEPILRVCRDRGLMLFEDCCQSHFAAYNGRAVGLFGDAAFFSFYPTKNLGGFGDGGCVVTRSEELARQVRILRNYGSDVRYHNVETGYNGRLDELQAGLLSVRLSHREALLAGRRWAAERYLAEIRNSLVRLPALPPGCTHTWYQFVVRAENREAFIAFLRRRGVGTDVAWRTPPYLQPCIRERFGYQKGDFPVTDAICASVVSLPMMDGLREDEVSLVIGAVNAYEGMENG